MGNEKIDEWLNKVRDDIAPFLNNYEEDEFQENMSQLSDISLLTIWPMIITVKLGAEINEARILQEFGWLKTLGWLIKDDKESSYITAMAEISATTKHKSPEKNLNYGDFLIKPMDIMVNIIHSKKEFLWVLLSKLYPKNEMLDNFDEMISRYYILLFSYLHHCNSKETLMSFSLEDMLKYISKSNDSETAFRLSYMSLRYISNGDYNSYTLEIIDNKVEIQPEYLLKYSQTESGKELDPNEQIYSFNGSQIKSNDFSKLLLDQIFDTANNISDLYFNLAKTIRNLPSQLPQLYLDNQKAFSDIFEDVYSFFEYTSIFYHYEDLMEFCKKLESEFDINRLSKRGKLDKKLFKKHLKYIKDIISFQKNKNFELYPKIVDILSDTNKELKALKRDLIYNYPSIIKDARSCNNTFKLDICKKGCPYLKKVESEINLYMTEMLAKKIDDDNEYKDITDYNTLITKNWERDILRIIYPLIKLDAEGKPMYANTVDNTTIEKDMDALLKYEKERIFQYQKKMKRKK
ncbi:hypothetical protein MTBBW1_2230004 [Desulfamplus magnetovallimortis]|uniref:Uncharacterized protein n=2 Tax=Desulfamplus magnetovallimortis TaxID=1246637 RepID=A0A1W1HD65_9BACT|nr:hypothetical protein MTBBW1_2230004 [Desulfamplus magnetovallimortis]